MEQDRRFRREGEEIRNYYKSIENRERRVSNESTAGPGGIQNSRMKQSQQQPYQTYPKDGAPMESRYRANSNRPRGNSKAQLVGAEGDIPLMPVLPPEYSSQASLQHTHSSRARDSTPVRHATRQASPCWTWEKSQPLPSPSASKKGPSGKRPWRGKVIVCKTVDS